MIILKPGIDPFGGRGELDIAPPIGAWGEIKINEGETSSTDPNVMLYFQYSDRTISMIVSEDPLFIGAEWESVAKTKVWVFTGEGQKKIYAKFRDEDGLESSPKVAKIIVGTVSAGANNNTTVETVATPTFTPDAGTYEADQSVAISSATEGAIIYYTTDGEVPTELSAVYATAIAVAGDGTTLTIKAIAIKAGMVDSTVGSAAYTIDANKVSSPEFSVATGTYTADQTATGVPGSYWTASSPNGTYGGPNENCNMNGPWTSDLTMNGTYGTHDSTSATWLYTGEAPCNGSKYLLCICY